MREMHPEHALDNGGRALLVHAPGATTVRTMAMFERAGLMFGEPHEQQVPHVAEHMIGQGCAQLPSEQEFRAQINAGGSRFGAHTSLDSMQYNLKSPAHGWEAPLWALMRSLEAPIFSDEKLQTEREVVRNELTEKMHVPEEAIIPYILGSVGVRFMNLAEAAATLDGISTDHLRSFYRKTHVGNRLRTVVTADFTRISRDSVLGMLNGLDITTGPGGDEPVWEVTQPHEPVVFADYEGDQIDLEFRKLGQTPSDIDAIAGHVLTEAHLFTHPRSELFRGAREKGLVYRLSGARSLKAQALETTEIKTSVSSSKIGPLMHHVAETLLRDPASITQTELDEVKSFAVGRLVQDYESPGSIHNLACSMYRYGLSRMPVAGLVEHVMALSLPEYQQARYNYARGGVGVVAAVGSPTLDRPEIRSSLQKMQTFLANL